MFARSTRRKGVRSLERVAQMLDHALPSAHGGVLLRMGDLKSRIPHAQDSHQERETRSAHAQTESRGVTLARGAVRPVVAPRALNRSANREGGAAVRG